MGTTWGQQLSYTVASKPPWLVAAGVLAIGVVLVAAGGMQFDRLETVGVLYLVLGGGLFVVTRNTPGWVTGRRATGLVVVSLTASFAHFFGDLLLARLTYSDLSRELVFELIGLSVRRWLPVLSVGGVFLQGVATRSHEREVAAVIVVGPLVVIFWLKLLGSYAGVFWPILPLAAYVATLVGVALAGAPLYLLGSAVRRGNQGCSSRTD